MEQLSEKNFNIPEGVKPDTMETSDVLGDDGFGNSPEPMTRREFLGICFSGFGSLLVRKSLGAHSSDESPRVADEVLSGAVEYIIRPIDQNTPEQQEKCGARLTFSYGAIETLTINPYGPYGWFYGGFLSDLKNNERVHPPRTFYDKVLSGAEVAYRWYLRHNRDRNEPYQLQMVPPGANPSEVAERAQKGIFRCYEITTLAHWGFGKMGVRTVPYVVSWVSRNDGRYYVHSNLAVWMNGTWYVVESTNGTVMPQGEYYQFLDSFYNFPRSIYTGRPIVHINQISVQRNTACK